MILIKGSKKWNHGRPVYVSRKEAGSGSFLEPPFSKTHYWGVVAGYDHGHGYQEYCSVSYYLESEHVPNHAKMMIRRVIGKENKPDIESPKIQDWICRVMGYFKGCYSGMNNKMETSWNASNLRYGLKDSNGDPIDPILNQDIHVGVHFIRKYYPEFKLEERHIKGAYWGKKPE